MNSTGLIACKHCDLLLQETDIKAGNKAHCPRCDAVLFRSQPHGLQISLIFALTSAALFLIANSFPIVTISSDGLLNSTTLIGAAYRLAQDGITSVAALVFVTTFVMPALQITSLIYLLFPLGIGRVSPGLALTFRLVHWVKPWAMIEVFMLGLLVTITKLNAFASVKPDVALGAFALLMLSITVASANFDAHAFWNRVNIKRQSEGVA